MKTEAIKELIEHCKHIGGIPAIFLKERIVAAEEELNAINAAQQSVHLTLGDSAASQALSPQSGESTPEVVPAATQRQVTQTVGRFVV